METDTSTLTEDVPDVAEEHEGWNGVTAPSHRGGAPRPLVDVIVELGYAERDQVEAALAAAPAGRHGASQALIENQILDPDQLARAIAERHGLDHVDLRTYNLDLAAANLLDQSAARRYDAIPIGFINQGTLMLAMADPANVLAIDDVAIMTGLEVRPVVSSREDILAVVTRINRLDSAIAEVAEEEVEEEEITDLDTDDAPVIKLVHSIVGEAIERGASDIHFDPAERDMQVRFRVDGVLSDSTTVPRRMVPGVISRIKIMAELDISEKRLPQDGRVGLTVDGRHVDIRVVTLPVQRGEAAIMRILDADAGALELDNIGMLDHERERLDHALRKTYGTILATGPTGSGKSTTLYGCLGTLNTPGRSIITVEDPVEYELDRVKQIQVNNKQGLTFAKGLRSMMRADPDIIMVGEIRDKETAKIAIEAALTGHLVLSTLHTNDAPTAVARLIEMGVEPFLVASAIDTVVAQRLTRRLCDSCKKEVTVPVAQMRDHGFQVDEDVTAWEPVGCTRCTGSGYKGRIGLFEVMVLSDHLRSMALSRESSEAIAEVAVREGMRRLREDGLDKIKLGWTSVAEVVRVTGV